MAQHQPLITPLIPIVLALDPRSRHRLLDSVVQRLLPMHRHPHQMRGRIA